MILNMELTYWAATVIADPKHGVQQSSMMTLILDGSKPRSALVYEAAPNKTTAPRSYMIPSSAVQKS